MRISTRIAARALGGALLLSLALGACSGSTNTASSNDDGASPGATQTSVAAHPALPTASPIRSDYSVPTIPPPPVAARATRCPASIQAEPKAPPADASWVYAFIDTNRGYGPSCPELRPGVECSIPFNGAWKIVGSTHGSVVFQVFENDAAVPVRSPELGPIPTGGRFSEQVRLTYKPSANARKATFRVLLKDASGKVVAQSDPETVPIPGCL